MVLLTSQLICCFNVVRRGATYHWKLNGNDDICRQAFCFRWCYLPVETTYSSSSFADNDVVRLIATSSNGCVDSTDVTITVFPLPTPQITGNDDICLGDNLQLSASGGATYQWKLNGSPVATGPTYSSSSFADNDVVRLIATSRLTPQITGNDDIWALPVVLLTSAHLKLTDCHGTPDVTVFPLPTPQITGNDDICLGDNLQLSASGGATYQWKLNGSPVATGPTYSSSSFADNDVVRLIATSSNGCVDSTDVTITVFPLPTPQITGNDDICLGDNLQLSASGGATYQWKLNGSPVATGPTYSSSSFADNDVVRLIATSSNGCVDSTDVTITVFPLPTPQITGNDDICLGDNLQLSASGGATYQWKLNGSPVATGPTYSSSSFADNDVVRLIATSSNGCVDSTDVTITVFPLPEASIKGYNVLCYGESTGSAKATATGGSGSYSYSWSNGQTGDSISNLSAGTYIVTVNDINGCSDTDTIIITQPDSELTCDADQNSPVTIYGQKDGVATVTPLGGTSPYTYLWDNGDTRATADTLGAGNHEVTVTDANGCETTCNVTIGEPGELTCDIDLITDVDCYDSANGSAKVTANGGVGSYSYLWDNGDQRQTADTLRAGIHTVTVTDENGAETTCDIQIDQPDSIILIAPNDTTVSACLTQSEVNNEFSNWLARVEASGGKNLSVDNNNTGAPESCGGSVTVVWTATSDCPAAVTDTATFVVTDAPAVVLTAPDNDTIPACTSETEITSLFNSWLDEVTYSGGCDLEVSYDSSLVAPAACGGEVEVIWTASSGCEDDISDTATFVVTDAPAVVLTAPDNDTIPACTSETEITSLFNSWLDEVTYSGGCDLEVSYDSSLVAPAACGGEVEVIWTASSGCEDDISDTATFVVTDAPAVVLTAPDNDTIPACTSETEITSLFNSWLDEVTYSGGCDLEVSYDSSLVAPAACGGEVEVIWTASSGCEDDISDTATFVVTDAPAVVLTAPDNDTIPACTSETEITSLFNSWLDEVTYSGGCDLEVSYDSSLVAPAACGGEVEVIWTASSGCEDDISDTATFVVTDAPAVVLTAPDNDTIPACTSETEITSLFNSWLDEVTYSGGCDLEVSYDSSLVAPAACGGEVEVIWTASSGCEDDISDTATFVVTDAPAVVLTAPDNDTIPACTSETEITSLFNSWLDEVTYSGGCDLEVSYDSSLVAPAACGGEVEVIWTASSGCEDDISDTATFVVTDAPAVVLTAPDNDTIPACTSETEITSLFNSWLDEVTYSGGCDLEVSYDSSLVAPAACGGEVEVIWTASSGCEDDISDTATFVVTDAPAVVLTAPDNDTIPACTSETEITSLFNSWLDEVTYSGGCDLEVSYDSSLVAPAACGGEVEVIWTASSGCEDDISDTATFVVTDAPAVVLTAPDNDTIPACTSETEITSLFNSWLDEVTYSGGCDLEVSYDSSLVAPAACGGEVEVIWTASSGCEDDISDTATVVTDAPAVVLTAPDNDTIPACTSETEITSLFNSWLDEVTYSGGCDLEVSYDSSLVAPAACGGEVEVIWTASSGCEDDISDTATFVVTDAPAVVLTAPDNDTIPACTSETEITSLFNSWLDEVTYSGGCDLEVSYDSSLVAPAACGGEVEVIWTASSGCEDDISDTATFVVTDAPAVVLTAPDNDTIPACTSETEITSLFNSWLDEVTYSGGCDLEVSYDSSLVAPAACGGEVEVIWTASSGCEDDISDTATFVVTDAPAVVLTAPDNDTIPACTSETEITSLFNSWLDEVTYSGGCDLEVSYDSSLVAPAACGGEVEVIWTASSGCEDDISDTATFVVTDAPAVVLTAPDNDTIPACTSETEITSLFNSWLDEVTYSGGCDLEVSYDSSLVAPAACGGEVEVIWTASSGCEDDISDTATFVVTDAPAVVLTAPDNDTIPACTSETEITSLFNSWLDEVTYSGGCDLEVSYDSSLVAPAACGGEVEVIWTASSGCEDDISDTATFVVTDAPAVVLTAPDNDTIPACTSETEITSLFNSWLDEVTYSGGCDLEVSYDSSLVAPAACGGEVEVIWTASSGCEDDISDTATFVVTDAPAVVLTAPDNETVDACMTQQEVNAAFNSWLDEVTYSGGCNLEVNNNAQGAPNACGGSVTVTWTATSNCEETVRDRATFTVEEADEVILIAPSNETVAACMSQQEINAAFANWLEKVQYSGGCELEVRNNAEVAPNACGGSVTVTWTATSNCEETVRDRATFTVEENTDFTITSATDLTVSCDGNGNTEQLNQWLDNYGGASVSNGCNLITWSNDFDTLTTACCNTGYATVTFTATDACQNTVSTTAVFTIVDNSAPTFTAPADITIYSGENCQYDASVQATGDVTDEYDICCTDLDAEFTEVTEQGSCAGEWIITRTWTLADACGNEAEPQVQVITVIDNTAPTTVCNDITVQLDSTGVATITAADIDGGSTDNCGIDTMFISQSVFYCGGLGNNEVVLTVVDECGNVSTCTATVTVEEGSYECNPEQYNANDDILTLIYCPDRTASGNIDLYDNDEGFTRDNSSLNVLTSLPDGVTINDGNLDYLNEDASELVLSLSYAVCHTVNTDICDTADVTIVLLLDSDCDGYSDGDDIDDDDDGILDIHEQYPVNDDPGDGDIDTDGDGIVDRLDIDSDDDGIPDNIEWQQNIPEGAYSAEHFGGVDLGFDYYPPLGIDSDGDGWDDQYDDNENGGQNIYYYPLFDMDQDGTPDHQDPDSDNDGIPDYIEGWDANPHDTIADVEWIGTDSDKDGLDDAYDTYDTRGEWLHGKNAIGSGAPLQDMARDTANNIRDWRDDIDPIVIIPDPQAEGCELIIPDGFSPNQDGYNDYFKVEFVCEEGDLLFGEEYPDAKIEIFNRWGNLVFEKEQFGNEMNQGSTEAWWDGSSMHNWQVGKDKLPAGTYFYILYFNSGNREPVTGSVFLNN